MRDRWFSKASLTSFGFYRLSLLPTVIGIAFLFLSCAGQSSVREVSESNNITTIKVPFHAQESAKLCGLACIEMLNLYYRMDLEDTDRVRLQVEAKEEGGISGRSMKGALERAGYSTAVFHGDLEGETTGLFRQLERDRPLIVLIREDGMSAAHYCVAVGYDKDVLVLIDPSSGTRTMRRSEFYHAWKREDNFTLLAIPAAPSPGDSGAADVRSES